MTITIEQIAKMAGVSKTTVSRVLNNKPDVSPMTRETILNLIAEHGFQPNAFAKAISLQKSNSIGLIIPHEVNYIFSNPFYVEVMRGVSTEVDRQGYYLFICYPHDQNYVDIFRQKRVDGFVLMSPGSFAGSIIHSLMSAEAPFVSTSMIPHEGEMVSVDVDNQKGALLAMEHLVVTLGHRRIGFIGKPNLASSVERLNGYRTVLEKNQIPVDEELIHIADIATISGGASATDLLLNLPDPPTAIFAVNDMIAIGAIRAAQEHGLKVPQDFSVIGFDDIPLSECINPALTTIRQPAYEKGVWAARLIIEYIETKMKPLSQILDCELIVRGSTAPARG